MSQQLEQTIQKVLELAGFEESQVKFDSETGRLFVSIFDEGELVKKNQDFIIKDLQLILRLVSKRENILVFVDINNYKVERERLIIELARGAARKVMATKKEISLPAMNAYERRLIHSELSDNPEVKTESMGIGKFRYVVIKPI